MLKRFYELRNEIADFMQIKDKPSSELNDPKWICELAFLVNLTGFNGNDDPVNILLIVVQGPREFSRNATIFHDPYVSRTLLKDVKHSHNRFTELILRWIIPCYEMVIGYCLPWPETTEGSRCHMYDRDYGQMSLHNYTSPQPNASLVPCRYGWEFDYSVYATTVVTEWEMVCEKDFYSTLALVLLGLGGLIGNYIFGYLQDSLGRRPSFFIYLLIECVFGIATAFAPDFTSWLAFRFGVGFTVPAILGTPYVLAIELVGPSHRTMVTVLTNIAYSLGLVALAVVAYLVRDWRQLALATSVPFLTFFLYWWVLPESPRWLLARGRFDEAEKVLNTMARVNGRCLNPNLILDMKRKYQVERFSKEKCSEERSYGVMDLFRTPNLRRKTIIITFICLEKYCHQELLAKLSNLKRVMISTQSRIADGCAYCTRVQMNFSNSLGTEEMPFRWNETNSDLDEADCTAAMFQLELNSTRSFDDMTTLVLYCIGKMGISSSYVVLPLMASELYPTVVRGLGMSTSSVAGMLGPVFIPIVNYMGEDVLVLPLLIMGALLVAGGGCSLLLPETLHQQLPQTLEDGESFGREWCPLYSKNRVGEKSEKKRPMAPESPIKSLLHVSLKETPASTPIATDITSSTDVNSDTIFSVQEQTLRVTVV
nr:carcinine transporter [Halyomorpha halys]